MPASRWIVLPIFLLGLAVGAAAVIWAPGLLGPYLPPALAGKTQAVTGEVVRKQREADRLLFTLQSDQGAILVTMTEKVAEIDLLVAEGDTLTLALRGYEPFVTNPRIERVEKPRPASGTPPPAGSSAPAAPTPSASPDAPSGAPASPPAPGRPRT